LNKLRETQSNTKVVVIVGPTAVGKSDIALRLAKRINGEIISADSMQAYRGMEIMSQSPSEPEKRSVPHHLVNFLQPSDEYSAAKFSKLANGKINEIIGNGRTPVIVGGSGLYIKALINGIFPSKGKNILVRKRLEALARKKGPGVLFERLQEVDRKASLKVHPNDQKRIIRALEVHEIDKRTKTSLIKETKGLKDDYEVIEFGLIRDRKNIYERINDRVDKMFERGIVDEARKLFRKEIGMTAGQAIGVKELKGYVQKEYSLSRTKEILKQNTRRFAKRQLTWFRALEDITWLDLDLIGENETVNLLIKDIGVRS
jgi:tRNA dimethylallyltransferase